MTRFKPFSASALAAGGGILACLGLYFAFVRPPLLPEDLRSIGASLALIEATVPGLLLSFALPWVCALVLYRFEPGSNHTDAETSRARDLVEPPTRENR